MRGIEPTTVRIALGFALGLTVAVAFAACSPSAPDSAEIQTKFEEVLGTAQECDDTAIESQCVLVYPGCPLGQFAAVRRDMAVTVDESARALLRQYAREDQVCAYQVTTALAPDALCIEGKCEVRDREPPPTPPDAGE